MPDRAPDAGELTRDRVAARFPWLVERGRDMIIGMDLDAMLSAMLLRHHLGWRLRGFYDLQTVYHDPSFTAADLRRCVWVDVDIYHPEVASVGHHVLTFTTGQNLPGHAKSFNPNLLRGISCSRFAQKYPLGTVHLLAWALGVDLPSANGGKYLFWLPDSSWISAQSKYKDNVEDWLSNYVPIHLLQSTFEEVNTRRFERGLVDLFDDLSEATGLVAGKGRVRSAHLGVSGMQCRLGKIDEASLRSFDNLCKFVHQRIGWQTDFQVPANLAQTSGKSNPYRTRLAEFLDRERVFSYAIPSPQVINYTTFDGAI